MNITSSTSLKNLERQTRAVSLISNTFKLSIQNSLKVHTYTFLISQDDDIIHHYKLINNRIQRSIHLALCSSLISSFPTTQGCFAIDMQAYVIYSLHEFSLGSTSFHYKLDLEEWSNVSLSINITKGDSFKLTDANRIVDLIGSLLRHKLYTTNTRYNQSFFKHQDHRDFKKSLSNILFELTRGLRLSGLRIVESPYVMLTISTPFGVFVKNNVFKQLRHLENYQEENWFKQFSADLKGLKCRVKLPQYRLTFKLSIHPDQAYKTTFFSEATGVPININDYYYQKYSIKLQYPNLPCILRSTKERGFLYYPIELCCLVDDKIPLPKIDPASEKEATSIASSEPQDRYAYCIEGKNYLERSASEEIKNFGIKMRPSNVSAKMLEKPTLVYGHNQHKNITDSSWKIGSFYEPAVLRKWRVVITTKIQFATVNNFIKSLVEKLIELGLETPLPKYSSIDKEKLTVDRLKELVDSDLVLFIIDNKSTHLHRIIHHVFDRSLQKTAALCVRACSLIGKTQQVFRTLTQKINFRLNGINTAFLNFGDLNLNLKPSSLMIVGLDVTHPDNELKFTSIAGCTYTYGPDLFRHKSFYGLQQATQELIDNPKELFDRMLSDFKKENNNNLPEYIIVFRDGVGNDQFEQVREQEISAFLELLGNQDTVPSLSFLIAQKRHSTRFFREDKNSSKLVNPDSGTLIDSDVVMMDGSEFYLFSQTCKRSTSRPTRYTILYKDKLTSEQLQQITYCLCFNCGRCSNALTIPSTLKYADTVAFDVREQLLGQGDPRRSVSPGRFTPSRFF